MSPEMNMATALVTNVQKLHHAYIMRLRQLPNVYIFLSTLIHTRDELYIQVSLYGRISYPHTYSWLSQLPKFIVSNQKEE